MEMKNDYNKILSESIAALEIKASLQKKDLQESFNGFTDTLKPLNLLKSGFQSVFSGENKEDLLNAAVGLGSGFLSKKLLLGNTKSFLGKNIGSAIQWSIAGLVSKNAEKLKEKASEIIDRYLEKRHKRAVKHQPSAEIKPVYTVKS
jgi:hypothetical protein